MSLDQLRANVAEQVRIARLRGANIPDGPVDREMAIRLIREALRRRSGKLWTVRGGTGTSYTWISIISPPARRVGPYDYMTEAEAKELGELLGIGGPVHHQGYDVSPGSASYRVAIARAQTGSTCGLQGPDHDRS